MEQHQWLHWLQPLKMDEDKTELIKEIKENRKKYLVMNQVPEPTLLRFKELADQEHEGHYGFTLKYLMDIHDGVCRSNHEEIFGVLEMHQQEISQLKQEIAELKDKPKEMKKTLAGRELKLI